MDVEMLDNPRYQLSNPAAMDPPAKASISSAAPADYVLFYAKIRAFLEDGCCTVKHTARRLFQQMAIDRGLAIDRHSVDLNPTDQAAATANGGRRSSGKRKAAYRAFYWEFRASTEALLREAEDLQLRLPLKNWDGGPMLVPDELQGADCCRGCNSCLEPEEHGGPVAAGNCEDKLSNSGDIITAPFVYSKKNMFYGGSKDAADGSDENIPLTRAQRIYLTNSILQSIDIHKELRRALGPHPGTKLCTIDCMYCTSLKKRIIEKTPIVLEHLLEANIFQDGFAVHDKTAADPASSCRSGGGRSSCCIGGCGICCCPSCRADEASVRPVPSNLPEVAATQQPPPGSDLRLRLHDSWNCCCRFQPLRLIRQYFGERLAFYYAWLGHLIWCLLSLTGVGLAFLVYGLVNASLMYSAESVKLMSQLSNSTKNITDGNAFTIHLVDLMQYIRLMFDNHLTIPFGCVLTAWNLAATEAWKRYEAGLSHHWGVADHELAERRRPAFTAHWRKRQPSQSQTCGSNPKAEFRRCFGVLTLIVLCVAIAIAVTVAYQVSKLVASNRHCTGGSSQAACIFLSIILPITGHVILMSFLDWAYSRLAKKITDWERHEYSSDYDWSYGLKAFAFRFVNNYASLFYIAFVRQEHLMYGEFTDRCRLDKMDVDCLNLLSVYTAGYIIGKSLLKILLDFIGSKTKSGSLASCLHAPTQRTLNTCCAQLKKVAYARELAVVSGLEHAAWAGGCAKDQAAVRHLSRQRSLAKEKSQDALLDEYLEKMTLHGFVVMFGSACYVTPLASLVAMAIDLRLDAKRLLHQHRRPVPQPGPGIGAVWHRLHDFLAHAGVFTTGGVLAFSSDSLRVHGYEPSTTNRLILFIVFSGGMFLLKLLVGAFMQGRSSKLKMRQKWEFIHVPKILHSGEAPVDAVDSLEEMHQASRWFHVLLPCFACVPRPRPEAGPHQV